MSRPPLPILQTVADTYRFLVENLLAFFHAAAGWYVLLAAVQIGLGNIVGNGAQRLMAIVASLIVAFVASTALAVSWHRLILLREAPRGPLPIRLTDAFAYVRRGLLLLAILALAGAAISALLWFLPPNPFVLLLVIAAYIAAFLLIGRFLLILPAAAVGEQRMTPRAAWAFTVRNSWRLFAGLSLCVVPLAFLSVLITANTGERIPVLAGAVALALSLLNVALAAGFASFAYRHFTQSAQTSFS